MTQVKKLMQQVVIYFFHTFTAQKKELGPFVVHSIHRDNRDSPYIVYLKCRDCPYVVHFILRDYPYV